MSTPAWCGASGWGNPEISGVIREIFDARSPQLTADMLKAIGAVDPKLPRPFRANKVMTAGGNLMDDEKVAERATVEQDQMVMPFYLICDVSYSMSGDMPALNDGVDRLRRAIVAEPIVDDVAQICIMTFSNDAKVRMPLAQMSETSVPHLSVEGATNYGSAFRLLAQTISQDSASLKQQGYKVYRPCAFFLTDGEPTDRDWRQTFDSTLTYNKQTSQGLKAYPLFVPFGFRSAPVNVLKQLAYPPERGKYYLANNTSVEDALKGILDIIMKTVVTAGKTAPTPQPVVALPAPAAGTGISQGDSEHSDFI